MVDSVSMALNIWKYISVCKRMPGKKCLRVIAAYWARMIGRCQRDLQQNPIYIMDQINNG